MGSVTSPARIRADPQRLALARGHNLEVPKPCSHVCSLAGTEMSLQTEEAEERGHKVFEDCLIKVLEKVPKGT